MNFSDKNRFANQLHFVSSSHFSTFTYIFLVIVTKCNPELRNKFSLFVTIVTIQIQNLLTIQLNKDFTHTKMKR